MRWRTTAVILFCTSTMAAQNAPNRFRITGPITGTEEYTVTRGPEGTTFAGKTSIQNRGIEFTHKLTLAPDNTLHRYEFSAAVAGQTQTVDAVREAGQIIMRAQAGGQSMDKPAPFTASTVVLDNAVVAHFQALLEHMGSRKSESLAVLVPQRMSVVSGEVKHVGDETGTLAGQPVSLRKYSLALPTVSVEFWADAASNQLMRVSVPAQNVEMVREGFAASAPPPPATAAAPSDVVEREVKFPSSGLQFPATLCLPKDLKGKPPLVVLVHGSGPHDRDETIGPNKPFRDLAHALASAGIATLRYDKRTYAFTGKIDMKTFTLDQEVTDDAVAALTYAASLPEVDASRLFVLGHSLGGTMAPFIAQRHSKLRGMILMAAGARPINEIIADQVKLGLQQEGKSDAEIAAALAKNKEKFDKIRTAPATEMFSFAPAAYWRDWLARDTAGAVRKSSMPVLVLQGGKDVQVGSADFDLLKRAIAGKPGSDSRLFPQLNHLFMPAQEGARIGDYSAAAHVAPEVSQTIAEWVKKQ